MADQKQQQESLNIELKNNVHKGFSNIYIASVIALYWLVSISMVYLNKVVLSNKDASIPAPLFITWFQCAITCLICIVLGIVGENSRKLGRSLFSDYPIVSYNFESGMRVLPLSIVFVGMISFNNICLKYVEVSFYNVARSLSIVFNVIFTYYLLGKPTTWQTCATLIVVILGFALGINGEVNLSVLGTVCGVISSVFVSLNSIYTSKMLPVVENNKSLLLYYNNANASMLFIPLIAYLEYNVIYEHSEKLLSIAFWAVMLVTGVMGFAIGLVTVLQVQATSPLTHNISGTAKAAVQSLLAFFIWHNAATVRGVLGILVVILGSGWYAVVQVYGGRFCPAAVSVSVGGAAKSDAKV